MEDILKKILSEMKELKTDVDELKIDMVELKTDVDELKTDMVELKTDVGELKTDMVELKTDIGELKMGQARLEVGQQKLQKILIESLGTYTEKITEYVNDKTEVLNKRVYKVESEIERLSRQ